MKNVPTQRLAKQGNRDYNYIFLYGHKLIAYFIRANKQFSIANTSTSKAFNSYFPNIITLNRNLADIGCYTWHIHIYF